MSAVFPFVRGFLRRAAERPRLQPRAFAVAAAAVALVAIALTVSLSSRTPETGEVVVRRGALQPSVPFSGTLAAARSDTYGATVPGVELKILWLVEEGTLVEPGDRLIQFDAAPFQKDLDTARARARELANETEQARLASEALSLKSVSDVAEARVSAASSDRDLQALVNTGAPLSARESAHEIEQRQRILEEAEEKLAGLEPFVEKGFISREEFRAARSRRDQAVADLELARARHAALVRQTNPDLIRRRVEENTKQKSGLHVLEKRTRVALAQAETATRLAAIRLEETQRQIAEAEKRIAGCKVTARAPGLAVHSEVFDRSGERRKIRVGDSVWGGTTVVTLPDLTRLTIEGRVPEPEMHHLASGQPVRVRLDAFPDRNLSGILRSIGSVAASEKNESRTFPVTISLDQTDPRFRPGMIARCSILGAPIRDALFLPLEAIEREEGGTFVRVRRLLRGVARRAVTLGRSTSQHVEVREGVREGDRVRLPDGAEK